MAIRITDPDSGHDTGKTCIGGGMYCLIAFRSTRMVLCDLMTVCSNMEKAVAVVVFVNTFYLNGM